MGSLMPIGSGPDAEIIAVLNKVFSGRNLDSLRAHEGLTGESIFDRHHKLHRIAFRIGAYPARDYSPPGSSSPHGKSHQEDSKGRFTA